MADVGCRKQPAFRSTRRFPAARPLQWVALLACVLVPGRAALSQDRGAAALGSALQGLGVSTRVLIIGAHPDDEDTQVIAWLSRGRHVETAYLSLTRGDGGQNAIGNELGEALGVIRTEELLAARRVDGAKQFFTRAYDFGFSKNAEEAFTQWPHDSLLLDVMTVVRSFKPHVIISVFSGTPRDGHGQHQAAGILAREAYDWSADTIRVPRSATAGHGPWTVSKFYRGASFRRENATLQMNVGEYDPLLGRSYAEIAAISRSQHRSQAFGTLQPLGVRYDYLQREATRVPAPQDPKAEKSIFDGMDTTWARLRVDAGGTAAVAALDSLADVLGAVRRAFDPFAPDRLIPALGRVSRLAKAVSTGGTRSPNRTSPLRSLDCKSASTRRWRWQPACTEATASRELFAIGETSPITLVVYNRGRRPVVVDDGVVQGDQRSGRDRPSSIIVLPDSSLRRTFDALSFTAVSAPRWLSRPRRGRCWTTRSSARTKHRSRPRSVGGSPRRQHTVPALRAGCLPSCRPGPGRDPAADCRRAGGGGTTGPGTGVRSSTHTDRARAARAPAGDGRHRERCSRDAAPPPGTDSRQRGSFRERPSDRRHAVRLVHGARSAPAGRHVIDVSASDGRLEFATGYATINYEHIRPQRTYRPSRLVIEAVDVAATGGLRIAYIQGVGDNSAAALEQLGIAVTPIDPATLAQADLRGYSAIVIGPRAYETQPALVANNARLLNYARNGGTLVVQYGQYEMMQPGIMPYPVTINRPHDRVTVEGAPVTILDSTAAILRTPNRITVRDFDGWVQDRSLTCRGLSTPDTHRCSR
jgi:LmbE family N-acetylglucosaminyl deacetylase